MRQACAVGLSFSNRFIVYVWTGKNDAKTLGVDSNFFKKEKKSCVFKRIPIRVDGAKPRWNLIVRVKGDLRKSVGSDWRFNNLSGSHLQSQVTVGNSNECSDALVFVVTERWKSNLVGCEDGEWWLVHYDQIRLVSEGRSRFVTW